MVLYCVVRRWRRGGKKVRNGSICIKIHLKLFTHLKYLMRTTNDHQNCMRTLACFDALSRSQTHPNRQHIIYIHIATTQFKFQINNRILRRIWKKSNDTMIELKIRRQTKIYSIDCRFQYDINVFAKIKCVRVCRPINTYIWNLSSFCSAAHLNTKSRWDL